MKLNNEDLSEQQFNLSTFLDQGHLIEFYDIDEFRIGIRSLSALELDEIILEYKTYALDDVFKEAEAPVIFARRFLYSVDGKILSLDEGITLADSLPYGLIDRLFQEWQQLQQVRLDKIGINLETYCKTIASRMKYKLCKLLQVLPTDSKIRSMDPITRAWFYRNILEDEKELSNSLYEKVEYAVSFWDSKAAEKQRQIRLRAQGEEVDDSDHYRTTNFDKELIEGLKEIDPNLDTDNIKSLDDYIHFAQEVPFEDDIQNNMSGAKYSEEEIANLIVQLGKEKGSPLTETEKQITIYKLENGHVINLRQILNEATDLDIANTLPPEDILGSLSDLDNM